MIDKIPQDLLDKIQKIINLRDGAAAVGSTDEAEAAANKITQLLLKYNLDLFEVEKEGMRRKIETTEELWELDEHQTKHEADWVVYLFVAIADVNMCKSFHYIRRRKKYDQGQIAVVGSPLNVSLVYFICEQLIAKIRIAHKLAWKNYSGPEKANTYKRGFLSGAVIGIKMKLKESQKELEKSLLKEESHISGSAHINNMALMITTNKEAIDLFIQEKHGGLKNGRQSSLSGQGGMASGIAAGKGMQINKGVGSTIKGHLN